MNNLSGDVRGRLERRVQEQKRNTRLTFFIISLVLFIVFLVMSAVALESDRAVTALLDESAAGLAIILPFVGWILSLIYQGVMVAQDTKTGERQMLQAAATREMQDQLLEQHLGTIDEKPKRDIDVEETTLPERYELGDDGEIRRTNAS